VERKADRVRRARATSFVAGSPKPTDGLNGAGRKNVPDGLKPPVISRTGFDSARPSACPVRNDALGCLICARIRRRRQPETHETSRSAGVDGDAPPDLTRDRASRFRTPSSFRGRQQAGVYQSLLNPARPGCSPGLPGPVRSGRADRAFQ